MFKFYEIKKPKNYHSEIFDYFQFDVGDYFLLYGQIYNSDKGWYIVRCVVDTYTGVVCIESDYGEKIHTAYFCSILPNNMDKSIIRKMKIEKFL
jgi:hypothetical protein